MKFIDMELQQEQMQAEAASLSHTDCTSPTSPLNNDLTLPMGDPLSPTGHQYSPPTTSTGSLSPVDQLLSPISNSLSQGGSSPTLGISPQSSEEEDLLTPTEADGANNDHHHVLHEFR